MPYDDEMQVSLHPKMAAWLQNELINGGFEVEEDDDEKILDDTLKQIQPEPEPTSEEKRAREGEQALRKVRDVLHPLQLFLATCATNVEFLFNEIDLAHGILQDEMIPLAREHVKLCGELEEARREIELVTYERNTAKAEANDANHKLAEAHRQEGIQTKRAEQLAKGNNRLRDKLKEFYDDTNVRAKEDMWAALDVDNQTDAMAKLRLWSDLVRQRNELLQQLGASNGYDAQHTIRRLKEFVGHVGSHFGQQIPTTKVPEWTGTARKLSDQLGPVKTAP